MAICSSVMPSQPSHLLSSVLVQREASRAQRRFTLLFVLPIGERRVHGLREIIRQTIREILHDELGAAFAARLSISGEQLVERLGEKFDALGGELVGDSLHRDSGAREIIHGLPRNVDVFFEAGARMAVVAKGVERGRRNRINRIGPDEFLDVEHIAIGRIFGAGAGPEQALRLRAACREACQRGPLKMFL